MSDITMSGVVVKRQITATGKKKSRGLATDAVILYALLIIVICIPLMAILAPWVTPYDPAKQNLKERLVSPSLAHPFGTDQFGRDTFSRVLWGARTTLTISTLSILIAGSLGGLVGMLAGYKGGFLDDGVKSAVDVLMAFPTLLLGLMVLATLGPGTYNLIIAASLAFLPRFIRITRNITLSIRENEFILGAKVIGARDLRIVVLHVLPNLRDELTMVSVLWLAQAITMEAGLSFLGVGVQPPTASWGLMIREGYNFLYATPWAAFFPGMSITFYILLLSLLSDRIQARNKHA
ncbi:MAG: ABC transporter permease [Ardenticatenaceae bacterium]|nr:ABC transporter permease [Ardenticatenaceae bacterium]